MEKTKFTDGIHDISNDDYHASIGVSRSALMHLKKSPFHYQQKYLIEHEPETPTPAMVMGNLIHTAILEPHRFDEEYIVMPKIDRRTNVGKLAYNAFYATMGGRKAVSKEDCDLAWKIKDSVCENEIALSLLDEADIEKSIYFTHAPTGIQCKVRPDAWKGSIIIDLKTTMDASFRAFQSSAYKYGYFLQCGMIQQGLKSIGIDMESFVCIAVEKSSPHAVGLYTMDEEAIDYGVNMFNELMSNLASCCEKDKWPAYPIQNLTVPKYADYEVNYLELDE